MGLHPLMDKAEGTPLMDKAEGGSNAQFPSEWEPRLANVMRNVPPSVTREQVMKWLLEEEGHAGKVLKRAEESVSPRERAINKRRQKSGVTPKVPSDRELQIFRKDFGHFDKDGSGFLEWDEIRQLIKQQLMSYEDSEDGMAELMHEFDTDADGKISLDEYLNVILGKGWKTAYAAQVARQKEDAAGRKAAKLHARVDASTNRTYHRWRLLSKDYWGN